VDGSGAHFLSLFSLPRAIRFFSLAASAKCKSAKCSKGTDAASPLKAPQDSRLKAQAPKKRKNKRRKEKRRKEEKKRKKRKKKRKNGQTRP
jgi:hypothetical protein